METRTNEIAFIFGAPAHGKTTNLVDFILAYSKNRIVEHNGVAQVLFTGRSVLIFDPNGQYNDYKRAGAEIIDFNPSKTDQELLSIIQIMNKNNLSGKVEVLYVAPKYNGRLCSVEEMQRMVKLIVDNYMGGLLVLEDARVYFPRNLKALSKLLVQKRHLNTDVRANFHGISMIDRNSMFSVNKIIWHKDNDGIAKYKDKVTNFSLFQIAQTIIDSRYKADIWDKDHRFFNLTVLPLEDKIVQWSNPLQTIEDFTKSARTFLIDNSQASSARGYTNYFNEFCEKYQAKRTEFYEMRKLARKAWILEKLETMIQWNAKFKKPDFDNFKIICSNFLDKLDAS